MTRISALLIGEETLVVGCGDALRARGHALVGVVSQNRQVRAWATAAGVPVVAAADEIPGLVGEGGVDWLIAAANLAPVPAEIRARARAGAISFQDGPLPEYAGPNTPVWALLAGEKRHGVSWHILAGPRDEGDILYRKHVDIADDETAFSLNAKCYAAGLEGFDAVLDQIEAGALQRSPQDPGRRRYFKPSARPKGAGRLDFTKPVDDNLRLVRALDFAGYYNPIAAPKIEIAGEVILVGKARAGAATGAAPGTVLDASAEALTVAVAGGSVVLSDLTDAMGRPVAIDAMASRGSVLAALDPAGGDRLRHQIAAVAPVEEYWRARLADFRPAVLSLAQQTSAEAVWSDRRIAAPDRLDGDALVAALAAWALHNTGDWGAGLAFASAEIQAAAEAAPGYIAPWVPLILAVEDAGALPIAALAEALGADLAAAQRGSYATDLIARDPGLAAIEMPAVGISRDGPVPGTALTLAIGAGSVTLWHDTGALDAEAMRLLADRLALFFEGLAGPEAATQPLASLLALPAQERARILVEWNQTGAESDLGPIHAAFEARVDSSPDATALVFNDAEISYAELDASANALAHSLIAAGAEPGDRIGIYLNRSLELMVAAIAIHKVGAAYVPLDPAYPADRLVHYVTDSAANLVVTSEALAPSLPDSEARPVLVSDACDDTSRPEVEVPHDALAYVIYTSGSTGIPKGVQVEHRNVSNFFTGMDDFLDTGPGGVWMAVTSLGFDISVLELFYTLTRGFKVVIVSEESRVTLSDSATGDTDYSLSAQLIRHRATVLQCTPSMARMIMADEAARAAMSHLKQVLLGGEAVTASLTADIRSVTGAEIIDMYGPTETTIWSTAHRVQGGETGVVPIGKPMANQTAYVLDPAGEPVPIGLPGELWIGGLGVTRGYWQRDALNADRFRPDPFAAENGVRQFETARMYGTGDLVRWRVDGVLDFLGRTDHQVKIRGQRLELGEIEARINRQGGIRQTVVVPKGEPGAQRLVAYVEPAHAGVDTAAIRADLVANLPEVMVPSQFVVLDALPLTPNRKIDRKALPEPVEEEVERSGDGPAPGTDLEQAISAIWAEVLGTNDIRADDSFFALGGHSLLAVRVHREIKTRAGLENTAITEIFRFPVLRDLAAHLAAKIGAAAAPEPVPATDPATDPAAEFDRAAIMAKRREMRAGRGRAAE